MLRALSLRSIGLLVALGWLLAPLQGQGQDSLSIGSITAFPGTSDNLVTVSCTNTVDIHSLSIALTYPAGPLLFSGTTGGYPAGGGVSVAGTILETVSPGGVPEFFHVDASQAGVLIIGIVIDLMPALPSPAIPASATPQPLLHIAFDIPSLTPPSNYAISLTNDLGTPPISNTFSNAGVSTLPSLSSGVLTVQNPNIYSLDSVTVPTSVPVIMVARVTHDFPFQGFQSVISWNRNVLQYHSVTGRGTDADAILRPQNPGLSPTGEPWEGNVSGGFVEIKHEVGCGTSPGSCGSNRDLLTVAAVFDFSPPFVTPTVLLNPGINQSFLRYRFQPLAGAVNGTSTEVRYENGLGIPAQVNYVILDGGESVTPLVEHGTVTFDNSVEVFVRGNVNNDLAVNIADAIFVLTYLFAQGPTPTCRDAADVNDDSTIDISDAIFLVTYLFNNGLAPRPPFPFCATDPTTDALGCLMYTGGCSL